MAISVSGALTLGIVLLLGPLVHLLVHCCRKPESQQSAQPSDKPEREESTGIGYILGLLGYAIGIGNIWRFPYLCGKFGGFAFVIAYLFMLVLVSMPLFFAELALGHQTRKSTIDALKAVHPRWCGLGLAQAALVTLASTYYNVVIAYTLVYIAGCVLDPLPWMGPPGSTEKFWREQVLNKYPDGLQAGMSIGSVQWRLAVSLLIVQIVNYFAIGMSKKTLAKVTWVTVVGPIVLLAILLVQALQLDGALDGLRFYMARCEWEQLLDFKIWSTACSQILFSLSPGFGTAITMSSTAPKKQDVFKTVVIVGLANSTFSLIGGVAIFSILGHVAKETGKHVAEVAAASGPGLAFVAIADAMKTFGSFSNVMSVLFFVMLASLGVDSSFAWIETIVVILQDTLRNRGMSTNKPVVTGCVCVSLFLVGLVYCTRGGNEMLDVVDHYVGTLFLLLGCGVESIALKFGYNFKRILAGIKESTATAAKPEGRRVPLAAAWNFVMSWTMPLGPVCLFAYLFSSDIREPYGGYPTWLLAVGWACFGLCVLLLCSTLHARGESAQQGKTIDSVVPSVDGKVPGAATAISSSSPRAEETSTAPAGCQKGSEVTCHSGSFA